MPGRPTLIVLLLTATAACGAVEDDRPAQWSFIAPAIIFPNCTTSGCHSRLTRTGGIELDDIDGAYTILVGTGGRGNFVIPGDPARSQLLHLLRGREILRMPPDRPLPEADILLIERWILAGAPKD